MILKTPSGWMRIGKVCEIGTVGYQIEVFFWPQILRLRELGADVTIVSGESMTLTSKANDVGVKSVWVPMKKRFSPFSDLCNLCRLIWMFADGRYSLVHSISSKAGFLTSLAGWLLNVPIRVHTFAGLPWVTMHGFGRHISVACDWIIIWLNTECWVDGASQKHELMQMSGFAASKVKLLGCGSVCGVSFVRFDRKLRAGRRVKVREALNIAEESVVLIFLGRITREKGISDLWLAFEKAREVKNNLVLLLLGEEDAHYDPVDPYVLGELKASASVRFLGFKEAPEEFVAAADFLVMPSYREGFCNAVIEAAAYGMPTVGYRVMGLVDSIEHEKTGVLVEARNVDALSDQIIRLAQSPTIRAQMGEAAYQRCLQHFDQKVVADRAVDRYERLIERRQGPVI